MEELLERCAGIDVHRDTAVVSILKGFGKKTMRETKTFSTMTDGLRELARWLKENEISIVAMESTGVYWKPLFNVLEQEGVDVILANAKHIRNVPGRKTDVKDSEWIAKLLKCGLIARSFIPPEQIRNLRDLTRYRVSVAQDLATAKNRLIKVLESANIKLASVFSNVYGKSSWSIIQGIINGETDLDKLMINIDRNARTPREEIKQALNGSIKDHHRTMLKIMASHILEVENLIKSIDLEIQTILIHFSKESELLQSMPGVSELVAAKVIAEIGTNMDQFPTAQHLTSWAGLSPGNNESAGKKKVLT